MAGFAANTRDALKNYMNGTGTSVFTTTPTFTVALWNGDPTDAGSGGTEVTGTINLTRQTATFSSSGTDQVDNDALLNFGTASGSGSVTHVAIFNSTTLLFSVALSGTVSIASGDAVKINAGALTIDFV